MNRYGSIEKTFWARNVYQGTFAVAPPADLTILNTDWHQQFLFNKYTLLDAVSINTNIFVKNVGVFCNFADGLVFKTEIDVIDLAIQAFVIAPVAPPVVGTITLSPASRAVTGVGFAPLLPGSIIRSGLYTYIVEAIADDNNATLTDFPKNTLVGAAWAQWGATGPSVVINCTDIRSLNQFIPVERFLSPVAFSVTDPSFLLMLMVFDINQITGTTAHNVTFLTKSIDPAFAGDVVTMDVGITLEYTP